MRIAALGLLLVLSAAVAGQTPALKLYTPKNSGLPQVQVMNLRQAPDGALWVCTYGGIGRFNGRRFTNYSVRNGLNSNITFDVAFHNDTVWLLTRDGLDVLVNGRLSNYLMAGEYKFYNARLHLYDDSTRIIYNISTIRLEDNIPSQLLFDVRKKSFLTPISLTGSPQNMKYTGASIGHRYFYADDSLLASFPFDNPSIQLIKKFKGVLSPTVQVGQNEFLFTLTNFTASDIFDSLFIVQVAPDQILFSSSPYHPPPTQK
ncbi:MAG: hypothetical protein PHQ65_17730, partial [Bacteroidales bacterium]|nr:hypothetical protein [Bacteroidales bacterium]